MTQGARILRTVVLGQVHIEISRPPCLPGVVTERTGSTSCGGVDQHLLRCVMDGVTNNHGPASGCTLLVLGIVINLFGRLIQEATHEVKMGNGMSQFNRNEVRRIRACRW